MWTLLLITWQAAAGPTLAAPPALQAAPACIVEDDEVLVCGRRGSPHRLKPLAPRYEKPAVPRATIAVAGGEIAAEGEAAGVGGFVSNRAMVRLKLPF